MSMFRKADESRCKTICIILTVALIAETIFAAACFAGPVFRKGRDSGEDNRVNDTESNNVLCALETGKKRNLTDREKQLYDKCLVYKTAAEDKNDVAKITMACAYVAESAEYYHDESEEIRSAYSALVLGKAVCNGYAKGVQLLLKSVGIDSEVIYGYVDSDTLNHAWLIVYLDLDDSDGVDEKCPYHCDPLWCDTNVEGDQLDVEYMLLSDSEAMESRTWDVNRYPECRFGVSYGDDIWYFYGDMEEQILANR